LRAPLVVLGLALVAGCGSSPSPTVSTRLTIEEQTGTATSVLRPSRATLRCTSLGPTATGFLRDRASAACAFVHGGAIQRVARDQRSQRVCSQIYGGPQRAHVTGTVDGQHVDLTVTRTDGCGTGDWQALQRLLGDPEK
jgi:hypothetical protein